jgi:ELWxxDGT repeat protein
VHGIELWKSNGTAPGTALVKDVNPGSAGSLDRYADLTNVSGALFFAATNGVSGRQLWKSDGTAPGTVLVKDINGSKGSNVFNLTNVNGSLFFEARDDVHGSELWQSNGKAPGTVLVPGNASSYPGYLTNVNGTLFFRATDNVHGYEPWILGPVAASASAASALVLSLSLVSGPVADLPPSGGEADVPAATLSARDLSAIDSVNAALQQHLLLKETLTLATRLSESAGRSPAVLAPKRQPHWLGDFWSEDPGSAPLGPIKRA